jgi:hypothetical protein
MRQPDENTGPVGLGNAIYVRENELNLLVFEKTNAFQQNA